MESNKQQMLFPNESQHISGLKSRDWGVITLGQNKLESLFRCYTVLQQFNNVLVISWHQLVHYLMFLKELIL